MLVKVASPFANLFKTFAEVGFFLQVGSAIALSIAFTNYENDRTTDKSAADVVDNDAAVDGILVVGWCWGHNES